LQQSTFLTHFDSNRVLLKVGIQWPMYLGEGFLLTGDEGDRILVWRY